MATHERGIRRASWVSHLSAVAGVAIGVALVVSLLGASAQIAPGRHAASPPSQAKVEFDPEFLPQVLTSPDVSPGGRFGTSVAISGSTVVVGAPYDYNAVYDGQAYIENTTTGTVYTLTAPICCTFGNSVAIANGLVAVGAPQSTPLFANSSRPTSGSVYLYGAENGTLLSTFVSPNPTTGGEFGSSVALSGDLLVVGAPGEAAAGLSNAGHAYVFNLATGAVRMLSSPDPVAFGRFGYSVAISGNLVVVGAPLDSSVGHAFVFQASTGDVVASLVDPAPVTGASFGWSVAISGMVVAVGAPAQTPFTNGTAFEFNLLTGGEFTFHSFYPVNTGEFGLSVSIGGGMVLVGAPLETSGGEAEAGNAYLFSTSSGTLISAELAPPDWPAGGEFGWSVAMGATSAVIGAPLEYAGGLPIAGHAFLFTQIPVTFKSPNPANYGYLGSALSDYNGNIVVGACEETAAALSGAGHAYVVLGHAGPVLTLTSPNATTNGFFGRSVSNWGGIVVVGAPLETAYGNSKAGGVYLFNAATGALEGWLASPGRQADGEFGLSVAIAGDLIVAGAPGESIDSELYAGNAYVFYANNGTLAAVLANPSPTTSGGFGYSVAISDGTVVVGAPGDGTGGTAYLFNATHGTLLRTLVDPNAAPSMEFGAAVSISGSVAVVGAYGYSGFDGAAYGYSTGTGTLLYSLFSEYPIAGGAFGFSVSVADGVIAVGAIDETTPFGVASAGNVYLFSASSGALLDRYNSPYAQTGGSFGSAVAVSPGGEVLVGADEETPPLGVTEAGAAYWFFL